VELRGRLSDHTWQATEQRCQLFWFRLAEVLCEVFGDRLSVIKINLRAIPEHDSRNE
jgi:hypothetical protein